MLEKDRLELNVLGRAPADAARYQSRLRCHSTACCAESNEHVHDADFMNVVWLKNPIRTKDPKRRAENNRLCAKRRARGTYHVHQTYLRSVTVTKVVGRRSLAGESVERWM